MDNENTAKTKARHNLYLLLGILVYIAGYFFLRLVGNNYTGIMSFLAPFFILSGALIIVLGLLF